MTKKPTRLVRIGVLSDTHGVIDARVREKLSACHTIVHAGDIGTPAVLEELRGIAKKVVAVRGNNDPNSDLPETERIKLAAGFIVVLHGDGLEQPPSHEALREEWPDARAIVYGHTHRAVCDQTALPWVLNPGPAGRTRIKDGPSCLVIETRGTDWRIVMHRFPPG